MTPTTQTLLITSGTPTFGYSVTDATGRTRGELPLRWMPGDPIVLRFDGRDYRIDFERTRSGYVNDGFRFSLVDTQGDTLATAEKVHGKRIFQASIHGMAHRLEKRGGFFSLRYELRAANGDMIGSLIETTGFSLWKRRFRWELPTGIGGPVGLFLFFLVANLHFR